MACHRSAAFTLLELMVSLAIVFILAALVLSALSSARAKADATQCASNLHQLSLANLAYAAEHEGEYCPAQDVTNTIRWHGIRTGAGAAFDPTQGPLAPYLGAEGKVKLCPTFRDILQGAESFETGTGGYGYNATYVGGTPQNTFSPERIANIPQTVRTVMFTDTAFARKTGLQEYAFCEPWRSVAASGRLQGTLIPSVHFRHAGRANVAWCDGHVTSEEPSVLGQANTLYNADPGKEKLGWFGPSVSNGYWNPHADTIGETDAVR